MRFGEIPLAEASGAVLAHSVKIGERSLRKGRVLSAEDVVALAATGRKSVIAAVLETGDVGENVAATEIAKALGGPLLNIAAAFTGRVNFFSQTSGLLEIERDRIDRFNLVDETITLATLEPHAVVEPKQMVATLKIIPFAVRREAVDACIAEARAHRPLISVAPFQPRRVVLIQTRLPGLKESVLAKTVETTRDRLAALGSDLVLERRCEHRALELAPEIRAALGEGSDLVLIASASAIVDRRDVIPEAITMAGGEIEHFGMPVDPGNLLLMARVGTVPVLGLPGCARSPKVNGFDWVLQRLLAGLPIGRREIMRMGVGGLLADIPTPSRPLPRAKVAAEAAKVAPRAPRIAGLVLAAGQSRRMGTLNKLLIGIDGKPMVRHVVEAVQASQAGPLFVVTGHEREKIEAALDGIPVRFVFNPDYAHGLSTSVRAGIAALPEDVDGAVMCLGDMPRVAGAEIDRLIGAFNPLEGRAICLPTRRGKRGNPVLLAKSLFGEMAGISGDVGAKDLIAAHPELVAEIEMESDGVLTDIDTPQALARLAATAKIDA
ncbi:MAG TPA: molybdopterin-binding/glycosyltransferase family 2 protein [Stellaceae bacterium]|nr:molybdopterin-binding/glycosyltransferase family 2 protein [Stellaceae bacterium]